MAVAPEGGTTGQRARSKRVVNEEIVQDRAPDLGHTGHFPKHGPVGRGWAVVFTPTPNVVETRLFNALAVGENMSRFAFDCVNVAFLNAESTEEERIPVRMPEGCRKYCPKTGQELYGLLKKNLYGSPLAPKNYVPVGSSVRKDLDDFAAGSSSPELIDRICDHELFDEWCYSGDPGGSLWSGSKADTPESTAAAKAAVAAKVAAEQPADSDSDGGEPAAEAGASCASETGVGLSVQRFARLVREGVWYVPAGCSVRKDLDDFAAGSGSAELIDRIWNHELFDEWCYSGDPGGSLSLAEDTRDISGALR